MSGRELVWGLSTLPVRLNGRELVGPAPCGLSFASLGGPVVVVCGLHGGAGTSTLAFSLAAQAAAESDAPVLLAETDASSGDQARLTGVVSPFSLSELAIEFEAGRKISGNGVLYGRLRMIAESPKTSPAVADDVILQLVRVAGESHGLTVIDGGTLRHELTRRLLTVASHVVWVTTASPGSADGARLMLGLAPAMTAEQALVVRAPAAAARDVRRRLVLRSEGKRLRELAGQHMDKLVMVQDSPGVNGHVDLGERRVMAALTGLAWFLGS